MAESSLLSGRGRVVGDYLVGRQIGSGSFSLVWHARHRVRGTEVAIKEIAIGRLGKKLQDSLMSEIFILRTINHPNIIRLHDIIEVPGTIHIVLEYCKGGDLSVYIRRHGRVPEATAKRFMQQLADGLQVLRDNNLIHRDLKPQNLLLSSNKNNAVLKIADFGFARSLQPRGLAETLCGSPLYMAPEIMQLQKYDAKADLWSVGAILFQLVTGKTPFTGNSQIQLLQNIVKSTKLQFPLDNKDLTAECKDLCYKLLRRNPVERLTFEEFFNHPFVSRRKTDEALRSRISSRSVDGFPLSENNPTADTEDKSQEDFLPFVLDDDCSGPVESPSFSKRSSFAKSISGLPLGSRVDGREATSNILNNMGCTSGYGSAKGNLDNNNFGPPVNKSSNENLTELPRSIDQRSLNILSRAVDSLELIDQDYVLVSGPSSDLSTSSASTLKLSHLPCELETSPQASVNANATTSVPAPVIGASNTNICRTSSLESPSSAPGTSKGCLDMGHAAEQPSADCVTRIKSLQQCVSAIAELVHEKIEAGKQLEAFSIQLVILAILEQALHICHARAASAVEESPSQEGTKLKRSSSKKHCSPNTENFPGVNGPSNVSGQIEMEFVREVARADKLAKGIACGSMIMPDAMETIYQSALDLGKHGGAEELLQNNESAVQLYTNAVRLFSFLLVEAASLTVNPPFSLTNSTRYRLRKYIDAINSRQQYLLSQKTALLKGGDQKCPPLDQ